MDGLDDKPLWKVTFAARYQSTKKHYSLYIVANDTDEAILLAKKWYIEHYEETEQEPREPYIKSIKIICNFIVC